MIITWKQIYFSTQIPAMLMHLPAPQFQLHKILCVAVSSTVGHHVERRHHLQIVYLKYVILVD